MPHYPHVLPRPSPQPHPGTQGQPGSQHLAPRDPDLGHCPPPHCRRLPPHPPTTTCGVLADGKAESRLHESAFWPKSRPPRTRPHCHRRRHLGRHRLCHCPLRPGHERKYRNPCPTAEPPCLLSVHGPKELLGMPLLPPNSPPSPSASPSSFKPPLTPPPRSGASTSICRRAAAPQPQSVAAQRRLTPTPAPVPTETPSHERQVHLWQDVGPSARPGHRAMRLGSTCGPRSPAACDFLWRD